MKTLPPLLATYVEKYASAVPSSSTGMLLHQEGHMRLAPDKPWLPFTAEQTMRADTSAFHWHARVKMAPLMTAIVDDFYEGGKGGLDAKIFGLISVAHAAGPATDRGEVQRYLAELAWCPHAFLLNDELHLEQTNDATVRVWVQDEATSMNLHFDDRGRISGASTPSRPRDDKTASPWAGDFTEWAEFDGVSAPVAGEVRWELPSGPFTYWRGRVTTISWT